MSLLLPDDLSVFIAPGHAVAVRWEGSLRPRVSAKQLYTSRQRDEGQPWEAAVTALGAALDERPPRRVRVILSNHFVQYLVQPWRDDLKDLDEEMAFARHALSQIYGPAVQGWSIKLSDSAPGDNRVAAAVPADLLTALGAETDRVGAKLTSVQPYFAAAFNNWRKDLSREGASWLVTHEPGRLCLGLVDQRRWRWLRGVRVGDDWREQLPELVENETLMAEVERPPTEVLVFAPSEPRLAVRAGARFPFLGLRLDPVPGFVPEEDNMFGLAVIG